jgi:zinc transport system substrate-binding protein
MYKKIFQIIFIFFVSCTSPKKDSTIPLVIVTVPPHAYFVKKIAGDSVKVHTLTPQGYNPHLHEGIPSQILGIEQAACWFRIGEPFERQVLPTLKEKNPNMMIVDLTEYVSLLTYQEENLCHGGAHLETEGLDLHIWMSPKLAKIQAQVISEKLTELFPERKEEYQANLHTFTKELDALDLFCEKKLEGMKGKAFLISHPSLGYFAYDYELRQIPVECEGKSPLPKDLNKLFSLIEKYDIKCAFIQPQFDNKATLLIAKKYQLKTHEIDPYTENYVNGLKHITNVLSTCGYKND